MPINSFTSQSLAILMWNANGLSNHRNELITVLNDKRIDLALISETHFTSHTKFSIPGYNIITSNHPDNTAHAGAAIIIKSSLLYTPCQSIQENYLQSAILTIKLNHIPVTIAATYFPPKHKITLIQYEHFFNSLGHYFIVGGDLNAKNQFWGCHTTNPKGRTLLQLANLKKYSILAPPDPTYWPTSISKRPDILDIFITFTPNSFQNIIKNLLEPCSDHTSVLLSIDAQPSTQPRQPSLTNGSMDWGKFREIIEQKVVLKTRLKHPNDIEDAIQYFTEIIQSAAWSSSTQISPRSQNSFPIPIHIRELIAKKRRARAIWQRTRLPSDKNIFNNLASSLKRILKQLRNDNFSSWVSSLTSKNGSLWKATRNCLKQKPINSPLKKEDNTWCKTDKEKAELFRSHLTKVFQPHHDMVNNAFEEHIENSLISPLPLYLPPKPFTPGELQYYIKLFPLKKSPGLDLITAEVARQLPKKAITHLTHIFNSILRLSYFPLQWKTSIIILILKPGKPPETPSSYRPISLLPLFAKLCEKLVLKRISPFINNVSTIPQTQFGFRKGHSTIHQIHRLTDSIANSLEKKEYCSAVLLDVAQAFDKVWHPGLLYKLKKILPPPYYLFFKSYIEDRYFTTKVGCEISTLAPLAAGVPQGAISSPILFNLYSADQPTTHHTSVADFADDKIIYTSHENPLTVGYNLQTHLDHMSSWYTKWKIKINHTKSSHLTFTLKQGAVPPITLNGLVIPKVTSSRYLGLILDQRLTWADHIKSKRVLLNARRKSLSYLIGKHSKLNLKTKLLLYKTLLMPVWTYGIQLWGAAKKSNINKIQTFQSITLRIITNAPFYVSNRTLHTDLRVNTVDETARLLYKRFRLRLTNHPNPLISALNSDTIPGNPPRRLKRRWCRDLNQN